MAEFIRSLPKKSTKSHITPSTMKHLFINSIALLALAGTSQAVSSVIVENFVNYGSTAVQLSGQSGGAGFSGNWVNVGGGVYGYTNTNLTSSVTGYTNTGLTGSTSGAASNNGFNSGLSGFNSTRAITRPTVYLGVTGNTVWFSFTLQVNDTTTGNNAFFNLFNTSNMFETGNFVIGAGTSPLNPTRFSSYQDFGSTFGAAVTSGATNLIVGRVTVDSAGFDNLSVWYNPTDVSSIGAMGTANYNTTTHEYSTFTPFMSGMSIGIRSDSATPNNNFIDSARIAYGGTTQENFVAVIPEPSTTLLVGLGGLALAFGRRRSTAA